MEVVKGNRGEGGEYQKGEGDERQESRREEKRRTLLSRNEEREKRVRGAVFSIKI